MKTSCGMGQNDRYRIVYNGDYEEQVRVYEIEAMASGRATLRQRVVDGGNLTRFSTSDILGPWRGEGGDGTLNQSETEQVVRALEVSGVFGPPPVGLDLRSEESFWTVAYCRGGRYGFTAYLYPSPRYEAVSFDEVLLRLDTTGIPLRQPERFVPSAMRDNEVREGKLISFRMRVGENGLVGATPFGTGR